MKLQDILIGFAVLIILSLGILMNFNVNRHSGHSGREAACYMNMRVLLGAIEMYNMDHSILKDDLVAGDGERMITMGYLKSPVKCPGDAFPRSSNPFLQSRLAILANNLSAADLAYKRVFPADYHGVRLASEGRIVCPMHGTLE